MSQLFRFASPPLAAASTAALLIVLVALGAGCGGDDGPATGPQALPPASLSPTAGDPIEVGGAATAVTVGEDSVWVVDNAGGTVIRVDPATMERDGKPIKAGGGPSAITAGEGAIYVTGGDDAVRRIDPASGQAQKSATEVPTPGGIAAGEGAVWVSSRTAGTLSRLDPTSLEPVGEPIDVGPSPGDVAITDGSVWVANGENPTPGTTGTVTRVDPGSGEVTATIELGEIATLALAAGAEDGGLWAAATDDQLSQRIKLVQIDTDANEISGDPVPLEGASLPVSLAVGEGAVWATIIGGVRPPDPKPEPGEVAYVPFGTNSVADDRVEVPDRPEGIAVGEGMVWVGSASEGKLTPIAPGG